MTGSSERTLPPLHVVTDEWVVARPDFATRAEEVARRGGTRIALHLRAPGAGGRRLYQLADQLRRATRDAGALLLINGRVDVAAAVGADGVQLGARAVPPGAARRLLGAAARIGVSVHSPQEAAAAARDGADLVVAGTLFATASHPGRPGQGTGWLRSISGLGVPVVGIGGIAPERVAEVVGAGVAGVAVLGGVWGAPDPAEAVDVYLAALEAACTSRARSRSS